VNWDDLKVFLAVHRAGSFAAGGRSLGLNATTVGRRITGFEDHLRARLFTRTSDGLVGTATAEAMLEAAEQMERQAMAIERQMGGKDARLQGTVRLASTGDFSSGFLLDQLGAFRRRHPDIALELLTSSAVHDLSRGAADIAVRFTTPGHGVPAGPQGPTEVLARRVCGIGIGVFATSAYLERSGVPEDLERLGGFDLVVPGKSLRLMPGYTWCERVRANNRVSLTVDGLQSIAAATAAGLGLGALPCFMVARYPELIRVCAPHTVDERELWLMMPGDLRRVARVRAVQEFLLEVFEAWEPVLAGRVSPREPL